MKNNFKRVFALLIAVVMCVTCVLPVFASGAEVECPGEGEVHTKDNCDYEQVGEPVEASCGTIGYTKYQCIKCHTGFIDDIVEGNDECVIEIVSTQAATCVEDGYINKHCSAHNKDFSETLPALSTADPKAHTWGAWIENADGTTQSRTCSVCNAVETEDVAPHTVHTWGKPVFNPDKLPTCTEDGEATIYCTTEGCNASKTIPVYKTSEYAQHAWDLTAGNYEVVSEKTCAAYAIWKVTCTVCGAVNNEYEDVAGGYAAHDFSVTVEAEAPGCDTPGWIEHLKCSTDGCGVISIDGVTEADSDDIAVAAAGHNWIDDPNKEDKEAICGQNGEHYIVCSVCGAEDTQVIVMPSDHTYAAEPLKKDPTCTENGIVIKYCLNCLKEIEATYIAPLDHHLASCTDHAACIAENGVACGLVETGRTNGDCTTAGTITYTCTICTGYNYTVTNEAAPGAGQHDLEWVRTAATCTNDGSEYQQCKNCSYSTTPVVIPTDPTAHVYDNGHENGYVFTTEPTCTTPGKAWKYCILCGEEDLDVIDVDPLGHTMPTGTTPTVEATCQNKASYTYNCSVCGVTVTEEVGELADHAYTEHVAVAPECGVEGNQKYYTCSTPGCGMTFDAEKNEIAAIPTIPALEHDWVDLEWTAPTCSNPVVWEMQKCSRNCGVADRKKTNAEGKEIVHIVDITDAAEHDCTATQVIGMGRPGSCSEVAIEHWACGSAATAAVTAIIDGVEQLIIPMGSTYGVRNTEYGRGHVADAIYMNETSIAVTATCLVEGKTAVYTCQFCSATIGGENLGYADHTYGDIHEANAPTCTMGGNDAYYQCTVVGCGDYFDADKNPIESIPFVDPLGHDYIEETKAPTCLQAGGKYITCSRCDYNTIENPEAALGHNYIVVETVVVGCENVGYVHMLCQNEVCDGDDEDNNYYIHEYIKSYTYATGHVMSTVKDCVTGDVHTCTNANCTYVNADGELVNGPYTVTDAPRGVHTNANGDVLTCEVGTGITDRVCADCGETIAEGVHTTITVTTAATCTENGYKITTCKHCDLFEEEQVANKTGHSEPTDFTIVNPATCTADGLKQKVCQNGCGEILASETIPMVAHSYTVYNEDWAADIGVAGQETSFCDYGCGTADVRPIPALNGIVFSYAYDNYVNPGYDFVNAGMIAVTVKYNATNASVNSILLALEFDKNIMTYVESIGEYTGFNASLCEVGYNNETGKVSISARANSEFSETGKVDVVLNGEGVLCTLVFAINDLALDNTNLDLTVVPENAMQGSSVVNAANEKVAVNYGTPVAPETTDMLGDVNNDGVVTDADTVKLVDFLFAAEGEDNYSAQADIDQDGDVDLDDYLALKKFTISSITYEDMCKGEVAA